MEISLILPNGKFINPGNPIPVSAINKGIEHIPPGRNKCFWMLGTSSEEVEGVEVLITAKQYIVNKRRYDLEPGYAIPAILTPKFTLVPKLREAFGKEKNVIKNKDGIPINKYWPIIEEAWHEQENKPKENIIEEYDFVKDAMTAMNEISELTESFDFQEEAEIDSDEESCDCLYVE